MRIDEPSHATRKVALRIQRFWQKPQRGWKRWILCLLLPAAWLYRVGLWLHQYHLKRQAEKLPACVISIGNLVVGGTGKSPLTLWLAGRLRDRGCSVAVLSRGYKRQGSKPARVSIDIQRRSSNRLEYGDESLMLALCLPDVPVWVGRDRRLTGRLAVEAGARVLLLDDGFQHLRLARDLDIVLVDASCPFGNGSLLPIGPLREPVSRLRRADLLILTNAHDPSRAYRTRIELFKRFPNKPILQFRSSIRRFVIGLEGEAIPKHKLFGKRALAFAGIASPERFYRSLRETGVELVAELSFADHHPYKSNDIERILRAASAARAQIMVTTQKDLVRLPAWLHTAVLSAELELIFDDDDEHTMVNLVDKSITRHISQQVQ